MNNILVHKLVDQLKMKKSHFIELPYLPFIIDLLLQQNNFTDTEYYLYLDKLLIYSSKLHKPVAKIYEDMRELKEEKDIKEFKPIPY